VIAATHRSLEAMVAEGRFRADLFYRLNAITLEVPPLRARRADVEPIARRFLARAVERAGRPCRGFAPAAMEYLERHDWPGNVRELRNAIERAVLVALSDLIRERDLPTRLREPQPTASFASPQAASEPAPPPPDDEMLDESAAGGEFRIRVQEYEVKLITEALRSVAGNKTEAARLLGLPIRTLTRRIKQLQIKDA
jgi:DNA-binding NtrC family response regulator